MNGSQFSGKDRKVLEKLEEMFARGCLHGSKDDVEYKKRQKRELLGLYK